MLETAGFTIFRNVFFSIIFVYRFLSKKVIVSTFNKEKVLLAQVSALFKKVFFTKFY